MHFKKNNFSLCSLKDRTALPKLATKPPGFIILFQIGSRVVFLHNSHGTPEFTDCGRLAGED